MYSDFINKKPENLSAYQPSTAVTNLTRDVKEAFGKGITILNRGWEELNNYSVIERENKDQRTFNAFVDESSEDPMEAWKWRGTRSMARDKAIDMHAHMTAVLAVPMAFAQNDKQEEDRQHSNVMRDVLEWLAINSEYRESYAHMMMGVLYSPAKYLGAEWIESYTKIKERDDAGELITKDVLDEELSGFRAPVYSADQVLITNAYEQNLQRQYIVLKRQYRSYADTKSRWDWHSHWDYVRPGIKTVYSSEDGLYYDIKDDEHADLVEEVTAWCRKTDTECTFLNGIYMGDDNVDDNPIRHRDNFNLPKVPLVAFGYERINEHFFYWKSLMNRVGWDNALLDAMYENTMNREILDIFTPMGLYGVEEFSTSVIFPGATVAFENPDAKAEPLLPRNTAGWQAMDKIEESIKGKSISETMSGNLPQATQKAYSVARAEQNAKTILRGAMRSISVSVMKYGDLMKDIALQHLTVAQWDEITGAEHYRTLILKDQLVEGKAVSKRIVFDGSLIGKRMTKEQVREAQLKMLTEIGWPKNKEHVYRVNPHVFSKLKYLIRIEPDEMIEKNSAFEKAIAERMYALLKNDPFMVPGVMTRELVNVNYRGRADEMVLNRSETRIQQGAQNVTVQQNTKALTPELMS